MNQNANTSVYLHKTGNGDSATKLFQNKKLQGMANNQEFVL